MTKVNIEGRGSRATIAPKSNMSDEQIETLLSDILFGDGKAAETINKQAKAAKVNAAIAAKVRPIDPGKPASRVAAEPIIANRSIGKAIPAGAKEVVWENGQVVEVDGKKLATGYKPKRTGGGGSAKEDAGKDLLKAVYIPALKAHKTFGAKCFEHTSEGFIIRMEEADYSIKLTKSKEMKIDTAAEDFEVERDFSVRGKAKNTAPAIAQHLCSILETEIQNRKSEFNFKIVSARASGIVLHHTLGEYTIKISKKRDRVGFEGEKAAAYE